MYPMSKKSMLGRICLLSIFMPVILLEALLSKCDDWYYAVRGLRMKMDSFANRKFPLKSKK